MSSHIPDIIDNKKGKKIKGTVVLMTKKVLEFDNLNLSGGIPGVYDAVFNADRLLVSGMVTLQLISAVNADPGNGSGKVGKPASFEVITTLITSLLEGQASYSVHFDWDDQIGIPGAFIIKSDHVTEFFLVSLTLDDVPNQGSIHFVCNSWIYPNSKYKSERIFFANRAYLPSETPGPLRKYREQELVNLRGDGVGKLENWDRVYDYATYNDLGNPDNGAEYVRPTLGGSSTYPYPRRGRTGRPPLASDSSTETRLPAIVQNFEIYVPRDERFGHVKIANFLAYLTKSFHNFISAGSSNELDSFEEVRRLYENGYNHSTVGQIHSFIKNLPLPLFKEIFRTDGENSLGFPLPQVIKENETAWMTDEEFAREMLAGANPCVIRCLKEFPPRSKLDAEVYGDQTSTITKKHLEVNLSGLTVDEALNRNRLFILDHHDAFMTYLRRINEPSNEGYAMTEKEKKEKETREGYASRTILFLKDDGTLKPLAIELSLPHPNGDKFGAVSKVYLPAEKGVESTIWLLAKAYVIVNDSCYHQLISHWLNTHAVIEPFVIATNRQLSVLHPIHKLLLPHYRDTMNINALARQALINAGGIIEDSFLPGKYAMEMSAKIYKNWVFPEQALPADLIKRGMAVKDPASPHGIRLVIEDYPYAADGLEIWSAIKTWVHQYCSFYYISDEKVKQDSELQCWWKELVEVGHGDLKDKSWWPKMQTREDLIETCTIIIWTASALHAAVNFGQYPYGGYILNRPTLSRRLIPEKGTVEYDEMKKNPQNAYLSTITPKQATLTGITVTEMLSMHTSDEYYLGQRDNPNWTFDAEPVQAFKEFGKKLAEIEEKLKVRNRDEELRNRAGPVKMPYTLLYPSSEEGLTGRGIPNSISI